MTSEKELDSCEWCGGLMPRADRKKYRGFFYHARCKTYAVERAEMRSSYSAFITQQEIK